ncbi:hypothetical protein [uncultured Cedecea sp.]|uniref:hypothetical protein n=1 Tax=uncultured Cedecea sp. TaxID=988762 RepID=UPI00260DAB5D|nr:hypothetical protein [uncultured Cedecea sp.]
MKTTITLDQLKEVYAQHSAEINLSDAVESMEQCNEQADQTYYHVVTGAALPTRTALQWANFFALQTAQEQGADRRATVKFHADAYGE